MKKIYMLLTAAMMTCAFAVDAQISKNTLVLGGNLTYYSTHNTTDDNSYEYKQRGTSVYVTAGKAIKENLVLGGGISYLSQKYIQPQAGVSTTQKNIGYGVNIFLRKYKPIGKAFYVFLEGTAGGNYNKSDNSPTTNYNNYKQSTVNLSVNPGISYAISKKFQLETGLNQVLGINYSHTKGDKGPTNSPYTTNTFNFVTGFNNTLFSSLYFGFRYFI